MPPLYIAITEKATGNLVNIVELDDPREAYCRIYNETDVNGHRAAPAENGKARKSGGKRRAAAAK